MCFACINVCAYWLPYSLFLNKRKQTYLIRAFTLCLHHWLPTLYCMSNISYLNANARRLWSTYRPWQNVGHVLSHCCFTSSMEIGMTLDVLRITYWQRHFFRYLPGREYSRIFSHVKGRDLQALFLIAHVV